MVDNSARWLYEGQTLGYDDHYTIYSNNIPVTWLLYQLYSFASGLKGYPYNPEFIWIQFQCVMLSLAVFCSVLLVLQVSRNLGISVIALVFQSIFQNLSLEDYSLYGRKHHCHADPDSSTGIHCSEWEKTEIPLWFLIMFLGCLGGIMKATCYVTLIAVVLVDLVWSAWEEVPMRKRLQKIGLKILLLIAAFRLGAFCKHGIYCSVQYDYNADMEIGWSNYMYNGLNEDTTGACSERDLRGIDLLLVRIKIPGYNMRWKESAKESVIVVFWGTIRFWL